MTMILRQRKAGVEYNRIDNEPGTGGCTSDMFESIGWRGGRRGQVQAISEKPDFSGVCAAVGGMRQPADTMVGEDGDDGEES